MPDMGGCSGFVDHDSAWTVSLLERDDACSDFATQAEAQEWHDFYLTSYGDIANLDGDNHGEACASLP